MNKDNFAVRSGVRPLDEESDHQVAGNVAVGAASKAASTGDISDQVAKLTQTVSDLVQKQASTARDQVIGAVGEARPPTPRPAVSIALGVTPCARRAACR